MTLISLVLPVYQVEGYLRQCLDSILAQSFTDIEVVAVDDRSPDHSAEILAEYAARDPRVKVLTLAENVGLGRARNAGLDHATGEYVWFLDSDDWLAVGALGAVAERLTDTGADLLVLGFDRVHWDGRVVPGSVNQVLSEAPETFTVDEWPKVINVLHVAWNRVTRRDLLMKLGFRFETGWYEDVSFSFPLLVAADRITALPRTCVHYRQRRSGAITRTKGDRHFEIFDHWEHAFARAGEYDATRAAAVHPLLFRRMIWHCLIVLRNADRLPRQSRRRFFARMAQAYRQFAPAGGYPRPDGGQGTRHRLVERGSYLAYQVFEGSASIKNKARAAVGLVLRRGRQVANHLYYRVQLTRPIDDSLAVYAAYWYRGVSCNPAAIAAKAAELAPNLRAVWVVTPGRAAALPPGTEHVVAGTPPYYRAMARARWLVNNVNWPKRVRKRRGTTHLMTHHGTPLKAMGLDQAEHPAGMKDPDLPAQMRRMDRWDFSLSANRHTTVAWASAYPGRHETLELGYPRNDRLAVATASDTAAVRAQLGLNESDRVVLYAPTHREWRTKNDQQVLDLEEFARRLGPGTVLLSRAHYFYVPAGTARAPEHRGRVLDVSAWPVVEDLYLAADVLITDYSSAMFDYAVLDRPVVVFAPDWPVYRELRGVYFDLTAEPPGAVATSYDELVALFESGEYAGGAADAARAAFRERFCALDDGGAAERVVRRVLLGEK